MLLNHEHKFSYKIEIYQTYNEVEGVLSCTTGLTSCIYLQVIIINGFINTNYMLFWLNLNEI